MQITTGIRTYPTCLHVIDFAISLPGAIIILTGCDGFRRDAARELILSVIGLQNWSKQKVLIGRRPVPAPPAGPFFVP